MKLLPEDLTKRYYKEKYPMSTGSGEWRDIKMEFEVIDDGIAGTDYQDWSGSYIDPQRTRDWKLRIEQCKVLIDSYKPKDETEAQEKEILQRKINAGLEIYDLILKSLK